MVRSEFVKGVLGDISGVMAAIVDMFFDAHGHDLLNAGFSVQLHSGSWVRLFLRLDMIIADEAALHMIFMNKGASGLKPCPLCMNVVNQKTARTIADRDAVDHCCADASRLQLHTRRTVNAALSHLRRMAPPATSRADFAELQTRLGWNHVPRSLLDDARRLVICHPCDRLLFDWMHVFFVAGVFNVHVGRLMATLKNHNITYRTLHEYVAQWSWPGLVGQHGPEVFCDKRARSSWSDGTLKATASEALSVFQTMACFFDSVSKDHPSDEVKQHIT